MRTNSLWVGILALVFGILILVFPDLLRWLVGIGLIITGTLTFLRMYRLI